MNKILAIITFIFFTCISIKPKDYYDKDPLEQWWEDC